MLTLTSTDTSSNKMGEEPEAVRFGPSVCVMSIGGFFLHVSERISSN